MEVLLHTVLRTVNDAIFPCIIPRYHRCYTPAFTHMHDDDATSCMKKSSIDRQHRYFKVLTCKDFVPSFCEITDTPVFTNCQCDV